MFWSLKIAVVALKSPRFLGKAEKQARRNSHNVMPKYIRDLKLEPLC